MKHTHRIAILIPLAVGASAVTCTIFIHALAVIATVSFVRHERRRGRVGAGFWVDFAIVVVAISVALVSHLIEIASWAGLVRNLWRISEVRSGILPFSGQLHDPGLR
jgi:hypothetical protein